MGVGGREGKDTSTKEGRGAAGGVEHLGTGKGSFFWGGYRIGRNLAETEP